MNHKLITIALVSLLTLMACGQPDTRSNSLSVSTPEPSAAPIIALTRQPMVVTTGGSDYLTVSSMQERVAKSSFIIVGEITGSGEVINASRDVDDRNKPASDSFGVGQVYHCHVIRYLKGTGPETLNIVQVEGFAPHANAASITQKDIEQLKASYDSVPFQTGTTYVLFLEPFQGIDVKDNYYSGALGLPWRFELLSNGRTQAEGPHDARISPDFGYDPNTPQVAQIEQLVQAEKTSAPTK